MKTNEFKCLIVVLALLMMPFTVKAEGSAGTVSIFHALGAGARQLGLGGACVATPFDATTIYWNPAAIDYLEQKNATFFYTNLLGGASYNYIGYVNPTVTIGTFGFGILRWGIGDISERLHDSSYEIGKFESSNYELLFSYGKVILSDYNLSIGANIKIEHQSWPGLSWKASDTGVGADFAIYYQPNFYGSMKGLAFGLLMQNLFAPKLKPGDVADELPRQFKLGVAKTVPLSPQGNKLLFMMDLNKAELNPFNFHVGAEYTYNNLAMVRVGFHNRNNSSNVVFGAGATYNMFQVDYSFAPIGVADFAGSHRLSVSINFGKTKTELIAQAREQEMLRIREEVENQQRLAREQEIKERLTEARRYFEEGDYIQAQIEFSAVLKLDAENGEAREKLELAKQKSEEEQMRLLQERIERETLEKEQIELDLYIRNHWQKGLAHYERGQYEEAIDEWNLVLKKDPNHQLAMEWRDRALTDLRNEVKSLIRQAETHAANHRYMEAIRLLDKAKQQNLEEMRLDDDIDAKIRHYSKALSSDQLYTKGLNHYDNREYGKAAEMFEEALGLDPTNKVIKDFYEKAKARASATNTELPPELKQKYFSGLNLSSKGQYEEALKIFENILEVQPNNKRVLLAIDKTKEKLEKTKRQKSSSNNR